MSDHVISGLVRKRAELAGELERLRSQLLHIDATLKIFGYKAPQNIKPHFTRKYAPMFKPGQLTALVGEAERSGCTDNVAVTNWIIMNGHAAQTDYERVRDSVKTCRRRLNQRDGIE